MEENQNDVQNSGTENVNNSQQETTSNTGNEQNAENTQSAQNSATSDNTTNTQPQNNANGFNVSSEDLKKESKETVNEVKNTFKNTDLKKDSQAAKGFFTAFFKNPLGTLKNVAADSKNSFLKIAIIVLVIWLVAIFLLGMIGMAKNYLFGAFGSFERFFNNLFSNMFDILKDLIAPIITVAVLSGLVYGFKKQKNKSFLTIASAIVIAKIPVVIASIASLLTLISSSVSKLTSPFSGFCSVLSTVLLYFAIRDLSDESENKTYFWRFALIIGIYYVIDFVLSFLGIYL